jgi:hypothetical protein
VSPALAAGRGRGAGETVFAVLVVVLLFVNVPNMLGRLAPPVLRYAELPIPVLTPLVAPGRPIGLRVTRCAADPLGGRDRILYTYTRALVRADTGERLAIAGGQSEMRLGCETVESRLNVVPTGTSPGRYYLEGVSLAVGSWRSDQVYWRTEEFEVAY